MKKLVAISIMAAMLLAVGVAAMASADDWIFLMRASSTAYTGYGPNLNVGVAPTASLVKLGTTSTTAGYIGSYIEGAVDTPPLYGTDKPAALPAGGKTWELRLWAATGFTPTTLRLAWWTVASKACPTDLIYTLEVVGDPTKKIVWTDGIPTGTSTNPVGYWDFTEFPKIAAADAVANGIALRFTAAPIPEPSSMLALASGLFGMAGFAIRRRK